MPATDTSKESYHAITDLGDKQREVYDALKTLGYATDRELTDHLDWPINQLLPRRGELVQYGFIKKHGEKWNPLTKRNVTLWVTSDPMAQKQVEKATGKIETKIERPKDMTKYLLRLKNGQAFTINADMKDEIEEAYAAKGKYGKTVTIANQVFALSNIAMPIVEYKAATPKAKEATREQVLIIKDGQWLPATLSEREMRKQHIIFRVQKIGVESAAIVSDLMTTYDGIYESVKDMRGVES